MGERALGPMVKESTLVAGWAMDDCRLVLLNCCKPPSQHNIGTIEGAGVVLKLVEVVVMIVGHVVVVRKVVEEVVAPDLNHTMGRGRSKDRPYPFPAQTGPKRFDPGLRPQHP